MMTYMPFKNIRINHSFKKNGEFCEIEFIFFLKIGTLLRACSIIKDTLYEMRWPLCNPMHLHSNDLLLDHNTKNNILTPIDTSFFQSMVSFIIKMWTKDR